jgi:hypothetical protein
MRKVLVAILSLCAIVGTFVILSQFSSPTGPVVETQMQNIADKVASDAVDQYKITAKPGGPIDRCAQAGMVSAAFLQAKNDVQYSAWKKIERKDCKAAGVPQ